MASFQLTETPGANITVNGGSFVHIAGNSTHIVNPTTPDERGLDLLLQGIARDAMYDSAERFPPPKCHPDTRVAIQKEIQDWVVDPGSAHSVFWLRASAGEGKSAIMQSIAQLLSSPDGNIVATFFFGRGWGIRTQGQYLFSTLAYQLAMNIPDLRFHIDQIMRLRPTLPSSSMDIQVRFLFVEAFARLGYLPSIPWTIIIDGLDGCDIESHLQAILNLIGEIVTIHHLPLRFLIASRPEPHIRQIFEGPILHGVTFCATISDHFDSSTDVEKFLRDRFADIYKRKARLLGNVIKQAWPSDEVIKLLVSKSSRQFVYASTVVKFVDQKFAHPQKQLDILLSSRVSHKDIFLDLDSLYVQILATYLDFGILVPILGFIIVMSEPMVSVIEDLLQLQQGELEMTLQGLHSILSWTETPVLTPRHGMVLQPLDPGMDESEGSWFRLMQEIHVYISNASVYDPKYGKIDITHASFVEFLVSRDRAGKYFIDSTDADSRIVAAGFYIMSNFILNSMRGNWRRPFSISTVLHMGRILYTNLSRLELLPESILDGISKIEDEFGKMDPALNTRVPVEGFVGIHLLITHTFRHIKVCSTNNTGLPEAFHQLSLVHQRYLRILYRLCENALFRKGLPLSIVPGLFAIRNDLSSEVLAYLFEIDKDIIEKHWKILGIDLELDGPSLLEKFFEYLPKMDLSTEENKQMCDRVHSRNVAFCSTVVLRFLSRSCADTPEPPKNVQRFIDGQFMYHLDELTLVPSNFDSALMLLDVLDGVKIHYSEVGTSSLYKLSCIWNLVKATLAWLAKLDQLSDGLKSFVFNKHVRYTFDRLFRQVFCVLRNSKGENEVSIREPFLGIERYLLKKNHFYWLSSEANIPYDPMTSNDPHTLESHYQITEERNTLFISDDLFLLDFNKLNLGNYLTDSQWARNLHISQDALYSSAFVYLDQVISKSNDNFDRIHETKKKMLLKTCTGYLQKECICDGSKKEEGSKDERNACVALQWSQYILTKLPGEYTFLEERRTLHEIVTRHTD